jgi:phosphoglycerate dehydrogenase-like enzyme
MSTFTVLQTENLEAEPAAWMRQRCNFIETASSGPDLEKHLAEADGLCVRTYTQVDQALLDKAPKLKVVGRAGVALENIDVAACRARGVEVVHTAGANTQAVIEYASRIILEAIRPPVFVSEVMDVEAWKDLRNSVALGRQLNELTVGILGLGRIGKGMARVMTAIGARVLYTDLIEIPEDQRFGAQPVDRATLLRESDVLTVHIDSRPSNKHLLSADGFATMKPDAVVVNTSRGFVIDNAALAGYLQQNPAAQVHLEVHDPEPYPADYPYLGLPNAYLYPHVAARTATALLNMSWVVRDIWRVLNGEEPEYPAPDTQTQ